MAKNTESTSLVSKVGGLSSGAAGLGLFLTCVSIAYANYMVYFGTEFDWVNTILLIPSTVFVGVVAIYKFVR